MNWLILTEYFPDSEKEELTGGVEGRCFNIVKTLSKEHNIKVICSHQPGQKRNSKVFNAQVIRVGPTTKHTSQGNVIGRFLFSISAYRYGRKLKNADLVEGESFITYPPAYFIGKKLKAKKVATWHETWIGEWIKNKGLITGLFGEIWERFSLKLKWDRIISVSIFTKEKLVDQGINPKKIIVIPNGIELKKLKEIKANKNQHPTICFFGRINWQKNIDVLIKSIALIKKRIPKIQCVIMGGGAALPSLKRLTQELNLDDNIKFLGYIKNHQDLLNEAKKCHVYVSPSTLEGFGITVLESMVLGLPYVVSDIKPFVEITNNGKGGFIFTKNDHQELAEKVMILIENEEIYKEKIKEAQKQAEKYDWKSVLDYGKLIKTNSKQ